MFSEGFEKVWETIAEKENLNILFHQDIYSLRRQSDHIVLKLWQGSYLRSTICDFLIWTAPMSEFLRLHRIILHIKTLLIFTGLQLMQVMKNILCLKVSNLTFSLLVWSTLRMQRRNFHTMPS